MRGAQQHISATSAESCWGAGPAGGRHAGLVGQVAGQQGASSEDTAGSGKAGCRRWGSKVFEAGQGFKGRWPNMDTPGCVDSGTFTAIPEALHHSDTGTQPQRRLCSPVLAFGEQCGLTKEVIGVRRILRVDRQQALQGHRAQLRMLCLVHCRAKEAPRISSRAEGNPGTVADRTETAALPHAKAPDPTTGPTERESKA